MKMQNFYLLMFINSCPNVEVACEISFRVFGGICRGFCWGMCKKLQVSLAIGGILIVVARSWLVVVVWN